MKFVSAIGYQDDGSYLFEFEQHDSGLACIGDQVWSDGKMVYIYDYASGVVIHEFAEEVENKKAFMGALRRVGLI